MRAARIVIDGSTAQRGGGFTYLVNVVPELVAQAPEHRFRVMLRNPTLIASLPEAPNLELDVLPPAAWPASAIPMPSRTTTTAGRCTSACGSRRCAGSRGCRRRAVRASSS
jgi:hypothetical protein